MRTAVASVEAPAIAISRSRGIDDLSFPLIQQMLRNLIIDAWQKDPILHLPTSDIDTHLLQVFRGWKHTLASYGLEISTGPVVPFRNTAALASVEYVEQGKAVPMLWLQHVRRMGIQWPVQNFDKPQGVFYDTNRKLLVKNSTQIIIRRFSAKEELRRITAAVLPERAFGAELIALENHLNYLYRPGGDLSYEEAVGLAAFLNSSLVDRYFRIANGNTQVNATELRKLPLPFWEQLVSIGQHVVRKHLEHDFDATEHIIMDVLKQDIIVGDEKEDIQLPIFRDSRIQMGKMQDAQRILGELGLPPAQQNEISALTLLALCNLNEDAAWSTITQQSITIHNMIGFMKEHYGRTYAENTREVVRRQVIHQFEQARLVDRNPDDPAQPTNSPNTSYALTEDAFLVLSQYGTAKWEEAITSFLERHGALWEHYQRSRVTAFLTFAEYKRHSNNIAWETEVWLAEIPEHMIHYNGERFLGPHV